MSIEAQKLLVQLLDGGAAFRPTSRKQAAQVQEMLMALGFVWVDGDMTVSAHEVCIKRGIYARNRTMSTLDEESVGKVRFSDCKTLLSLDIQSLITHSTQPLMRTFAHVAARQQELDAKLDRVLAALEPRKMLDIKKDKGVQP